MKKTIVITFSLLGGLAFSQVGINNDSPKSTFDIAAKTTDGSRPEGLIAPRLTGDQIKTGDALYGTDQKGSIIYATSAVVTTSPKTININAEGYYFFDGNIWQKIITTENTSNTNIYNSNGTLSTNRVVALDDKLLAFTSTATTGTSHFRVDGNTFNIDAVNNRVGIGVLVPTNPLDIRSGGVAGAVRIADGTQGEGKIFVSDAGGVGTWRDTSGETTVSSSTQGAATDLQTGGVLTSTGASVTVPTDGYYIVSPRVMVDKAPAPSASDARSCTGFITYNLRKGSPTTGALAYGADIHVSAGPTATDFVYSSSITKLTAGTYYLVMRYGSGATSCTSVTTRAHDFSITLLK